MKKAIFAALFAGLIMTGCAQKESEQPTYKSDEFDYTISTGTYAMDTKYESQIYPPAVMFKTEDNTFSFGFDAFSSYMNLGTYVIDHDEIVATTDDGQYTFVFKIIDETTVSFVADQSASTKMAEGKIAVPDGALFKLKSLFDAAENDETTYWMQSENEEEATDTISENTSDISGFDTKEEINVERYDITHDGVPDYIVTSLQYDAAMIKPSATKQERITEQLNVGAILVEVYAGREGSDQKMDEDLIWSQEYSNAHTGNGQLSIVHSNGQDWMMSSSLYIGQGLATPEYEVFSLNQKGEKNHLDIQSLEFEIDQSKLPDDYVNFQSSLKEYASDGVLIIACDIDLGYGLVRTEDTPYVTADYYDEAFDKF